MSAITQALQQTRVEPLEAVTVFWAAHVAATAALPLALDRALVGGARADRIGGAFLVGYEEALHSLVPTLPRATLASLAATEARGAHPKHIETRLAESGGELRLEGHKAWVTLAGEQLLVLATRGPPVNGKAPLVVVQLPRDRDGVSLLAQAPLPFVPEIPHATLRLDGVRVAPDELLPGDGWSDWVKPFRTVEDLHVHAALVGYLLSFSARLGVADSVREELTSVAAALRSISLESPDDPSAHLALAGTLARLNETIEAVEPTIAKASTDEAARWSRDRPLLSVASKAREARRVRAWERLRAATTNDAR